MDTRAVLTPRPKLPNVDASPSGEDAEQNGEEGEAHNPGKGEEGGGGSHDGPYGDGRTLKEI